MQTGGSSSLTRRILAQDTVSGFTCGEPALDAFFARHALRNDRSGIGCAYVMPGPAGTSPRVLGFYTLSMADVDRSGIASFFTGEVRATLPAYPLPVALIGRFAVHSDAAGKGYGAKLLGDALERIAAAAEQVGCVGVIVDAKTPQAEAFYRRFTFTTLDVEARYPRRMFLPIATLLDAR